MELERDFPGISAPVGAEACDGRYWARTRPWGSGGIEYPDFIGVWCSQIGSDSLKLLPQLLPGWGKSRRWYREHDDAAPKRLRTLSPRCAPRL